MRFLLRVLASRKMSERMDPGQKGFFQKRMFADHLKRYEFTCKMCKGKRILDIACGEGYGTRVLRRYAKEVVAVDIFDVDLKLLGFYKNVKFVRSDAIEFLQKNRKKFDVIISFETVEHIPQYQKFIRLLHKNLKKGGLLIMSTPNRKFTDIFFGRKFNPYHVKEFYTEELSKELTKIFVTEPVLYRQRPVEKKHIYISAIHAFMKNISEIIEDNPAITGIDNIFVVRNR
ncbi:MAG: class I SAM-dependent methyltransferase [Candidatus Aenigmarchaeota archaeon]|nr:class I SAM-dependent methyltransferase [Candidatus Aenigmarchaeota archaeon]